MMNGERRAANGERRTVWGLPVGEASRFALFENDRDDRLVKGQRCVKPLTRLEEAKRDASPTAFLRTLARAQGRTMSDLINE